MDNQPDRVPILMYHSISGGEGPTCIPKAVFLAQLDVIGAAGWTVAPLSSVAAWRRRGVPLPAKSLVITFDDGYVDFATDAYPGLAARGFVATVFVPTRRLGAPERWDGANRPPRPLMDWETARRLSANGIEFAPHGRTHANLANLSHPEIADEVIGSAADMREHLGSTPRHFAPPYGSVNPAALAVIAQTYDLSVGVELGVADLHSACHDLPRLEMHYYRDVRRFRDFLDGRGDHYLAARKFLRQLRRRVRPR